MSEEVRTERQPPSESKFFAFLDGVENLLKGNKPNFVRGTIFGIVTAVALAAWGFLAFFNHGGTFPDFDKLVHKDALPSVMYVHMSDQTREVEIHGSTDLRGTYRNMWNNNTGRIVGFRNGDVIQLAFIEDPDPVGQARHGIGSMKFERVVPDDSNGQQLWIGHEEGCDCTGRRTTDVGAVLSTEVDEAPVDAMAVINRFKEQPIDFGAPDDVLKERGLRRIAQSVKKEASR